MSVLILILKTCTNYLKDTMTERRRGLGEKERDLSFTDLPQVATWPGLDHAEVRGYRRLSGFLPRWVAGAHALG